MSRVIFAYAESVILSVTKYSLHFKWKIIMI